MKTRLLSSATARLLWGLVLGQAPLYAYAAGEGGPLSEYQPVMSDAFVQLLREADLEMVPGRALMQIERHIAGRQTARQVIGVEVEGARARPVRIARLVRATGAELLDLIGEEAGEITPPAFFRAPSPSTVVDEATSPAPSTPTPSTVVDEATSPAASTPPHQP